MIYLDYAATDPNSRFFTKDDIDVPDRFNPNAAYAVDDQHLLIECEARIMNKLGVKNGHILYFRTATDAAEWLANQFATDEVWCSPYEHDSIYNLCEGNVWEEKGGKKWGDSTIPARYHWSDYSVYFHQYVNHLNGRVFNIEEIGNDARRLDDTSYFIVDGTQAIGKYPIPKNLEDYADGFIMSGHKIGCPDLSFMWLSHRLCELLHASTSIRNQWDLKHGTLPVASVCALVDAVTEAIDKTTANRMHFTKLQAAMYQAFANNHLTCYDKSKSNGTGINLLTFYGDPINGEALQSWLAERECYIGVAGSSCTDAHDYRVTKALGLSQEEAERSIRVSFGEETTIEEIKEFVKLVKEFKDTYVH